MTAARKLEPVKPIPTDDAGAEPLEYGEEWEAEVERRAEEIRSGRVQAIPCEEVAAKIRAKYGWR
jgi:putative addiction module component (TIGR02574 family)